MMRILMWHGWLLEGSGSNVATARTAEAWRAAGHDVLLLCQERHPERYPWIDADGVGRRATGPSELRADGAAARAGRCVLLRPRIGSTLPVFVVDRYEGFDEVVRFVDLSDDELEAYLQANVEALRAAVEWHGSEVALTGHAIPGAVIGRRALGAGRYVAKIHGSDLEYAVRIQERLPRAGARGARAPRGPCSVPAARCWSVAPASCPEMRELGRVVAARGGRRGVPAATSRRGAARRRRRLDRRPGRGPRPARVARRRRWSVPSTGGTRRRSTRSPTTYDQAVPEPEAAARLRRARRHERRRSSDTWAS